MKNAFAIATIFIAAYALSTGAWGQKVYKCGSSYSQTPCTDGTAINVEDQRSQADKAAADKATQRDTKAGNAMEKSRLAEEKKADAASAKQAAQFAKEAKEKAKKSGKATSDSTLTAPKKHKGKSKAKDPEFFTAKSTAEKK
jgi:protein subunit release factor B